jgi:hypothetical protein
MSHTSALAYASASDVLRLPVMPPLPVPVALAPARAQPEPTATAGGGLPERRLPSRLDLIFGGFRLFNLKLRPEDSKRRIPNWRRHRYRTHHHDRIVLISHTPPAQYSGLQKSTRWYCALQRGAVEAWASLRAVPP